MTDRIRSSRRPIILAATLLAAAAAALVLGVVPRVRSDTFPGVVPDPAGAVFLVQAVISVLVAVALAIVAARAVDHPRSSIAILNVSGSLVFLLGMVLACFPLAFWVHGPAMHGAVVLMFLSAAAEFAALALMAAAASRLRRSTASPATSEDTSAWKLRVVPAAALGVGSLILGIFLGGGGLILAVVLGAYSLLGAYVLLHGLPRASRNLWIVLAMNAGLLLMALIVLLAESNKSVALQTLVLSIISIACSCGGLALAARTTRPPGASTN
jgi:hypothetical protein